MPSSASRARKRRAVKAEPLSEPTVSSVKPKPAALRRERAQCVLTRLLAPAARLGTDAAMLVMVRVPLTLLGTRAARLEARLHNAAREFRHELRLPAQNPSGRNADVAAVLTQGDAAQHHLHVRLTQAGVSARRAALRAVEARVDARDQRSGVYLNGSWMRLQHLLSVGHLHLRPHLLLGQTYPVEPRPKPGARRQERPIARSRPRQRRSALGAQSAAAPTPHRCHATTRSDNTLGRCADNATPADPRRFPPPTSYSLTFTRAA